MCRRRCNMRKRSSWSSGSSRWGASTTETIDDDVYGGGHQRLKRSSDSLPVRRSPASHHRVLLNRAGARRDDFSGDRTTSAIACTSKGEEISVSFELVEPPGMSVLTVDWQRGRRRRRWSESTGNVIAAHRDVVLLATTSYEDTYPPETGVDLFVYQASPSRDLSGGRRRPSLFRLPSAGGPVIYSHLMGTEAMGIMSCRNKDDEDSPSFVVAYLKMSPRTNEALLYRPGSGHWESFQNLHVHSANGGRHLRWWTTDAVVPFRLRYMIWVDYYRGMVVMDMSSQLRSSSSKKNRLPPPRLQYVPLPVDKVGDPEDITFSGRGCPKNSRRVCATRDGIKFISVDSQHWSNFGVGHRDVRTWSHRFRITTWSLREDDYTWRKDLTMHEEEFWDALDHGDHRFHFPHVEPEFPVVDMDNPDVVFFRLEKRDHCDRDDPKWVIEVDLRKKVLLAATAYSKKERDGLSSDAEAINSVRVSCYDHIVIEFPCYLDRGQARQGCKKRRR